MRVARFPVRVFLGTGLLNLKFLRPVQSHVHVGWKPLAVGPMVHEFPAKLIRPLSANCILPNGTSAVRRCARLARSRRNCPPRLFGQGPILVRRGL